MTEPEFRAPVRHRSAAQDSESAKPQGMTGFTLFLAITGSIVVASILLWIIALGGSAVLFSAVSTAVSRELPEIEEKAFAAPQTRRQQTTERLIYVPPQSVDRCKAETGGVINEHFAKCRRGYTFVAQTIEE